VTSRREFLAYTGVGALAAAVAGPVAGTVRAGEVPGSRARGTSDQYLPVHTLNGWTLPFVI